MSCRYCDYDSPDNQIFETGLVANDWYLDVQTAEYDPVDNDWIHQKVYINYCPWCGRDLNINGKRS